MGRHSYHESKSPADVRLSDHAERFEQAAQFIVRYTGLDVTDKNL